MENFSVKYFCDEVKSIDDPLDMYKFIYKKLEQLDRLIGSNSKEYKPYSAQMRYLSTFIKSFIWFLGNQDIRPAEIEDDNDYLLMKETLLVIKSKNC